MKTTTSKPQQRSAAVGPGSADLAPAVARQTPAGAPGIALQLDNARNLGHRFAHTDVYPRPAPGSPTFQAAPIVQRSAAGTHATGLPHSLRAGIESLSGIPLDDVRVHYNSARPASLEALAYTQGAEIHVGPGQERHLPHEAWHVVQQKRGRVQATRQLKGRGLNDSAALEREADAMGHKAAIKSSSEHGSGCGCAGCQQTANQESTSPQRSYPNTSNVPAIQLMCDRGHRNHSPGPCPDASGRIKNKVLERTRDREVKLGEHHKQGQGPAAKRKTTPKVEGRLTRHMNDALRGQRSKARMVGMKGQNIAWEVDRATEEKQQRRGPRRVLQHPGGGDSDDPLDYFEDQDYGAMSDTDDESEDYDE